MGSLYYVQFMAIGSNKCTSEISQSHFVQIWLEMNQPYLVLLGNRPLKLEPLSNPFVHRASLVLYGIAMVLIEPLGNFNSWRINLEKQSFA